MQRIVGLAWFIAMASARCIHFFDPTALILKGPYTDPEVDMNITELIRHWGYPAEEYEVETEDGYILSVNRIPYGRYNSSSPGLKPVAFLQHGLLAAGSNWVTNSPNTSLAFLLADAGYDVWIGNSRGNTWSRRHVTLQDTDSDFWDFSYDELAHLDIPAVVDFVLEKTGQEQIYYVGHSQGTTLAFIAFSCMPDLGKKIKMFFGLAPVASITYATSPMVYVSFLPDLVTHTVFGKKDFLPQSTIIEIFAKRFCPRTPKICENVFFLISGYNEGNLNATRIPVYATHCPAGTSTKNMVHWKQLRNYGKLRAFDNGIWNLWRYGWFYPPEYTIENMKVPTVLWSGGNDILAAPGDVEALLPKVSNLVYHEQIETWNHLDFIWGLDAAEKVYYKMIQFMDDNL